jgi:deoxycytidylate deaminase
MGVDENDDPHLRWLMLARNVSKHSTYKIQVGCVITKGNNPISVGFNKIKYNRLWSSPWNKSIHAEASAIRTSGKEYVKNSTAYIYREKGDGTPGLARPCADCMRRLVDFGVETIYYSKSEFPFWEKEYI